MASTPGTASRTRSLLVIAAVVAVAAGAFAYTGGWLTPHRLTPDRFLEQFRLPGGPASGHRRNHAKGLCFTGFFQANGAGSALSRAVVFTPGQYPVVGRFNLGSPDPAASDATTGVRGLSIRITTPDGQQWRSAMINAPEFPVSTPQAFYALLAAGRSKDPQAMPRFAASHPGFVAFGKAAARQVHTASYAGERYNSINSFIFIDRDGRRHAVRWTLSPAIAQVAATPEELASLGTDFLFKDLRERLAQGPLRFPMTVTVAAPTDNTADPNQAWPDERPHVEVGVLAVQQLEDESAGPCRDINYDPTVLPDGIALSDDPFPAARAAVYARSYDLRTGEEDHYPRTSAPAADGTAGAP